MNIIRGISFPSITCALIPAFVTFLTVQLIKWPSTGFVTNASYNILYLISPPNKIPDE